MGERMKISICGKGGSGKSTVVALLATEARDRDYRVLVVDSDESNSGLFHMLGFDHPPVPLMELVGGKKSLKQKMSQTNVLSEVQIATKQIPAQHLVQRDGLMLVGVGKILQSLEGCACPMGVLSREFLKKLTLAEDELAFYDALGSELLDDPSQVTRILDGTSNLGAGDIEQAFSWDLAIESNDPFSLGIRNTITVIPLPAALPLMGSALLGLLMLVRRRGL